MKTIIINSKKFGKHEVFVDDEDFELVNKYRWRIKKSPTFYAASRVKRSWMEHCDDAQINYENN